MVMFLLYSPLNQGLKPIEQDGNLITVKVFTLQSIKSRIETFIWTDKTILVQPFLLYSPLNQGLKHEHK